MSFQELRKLDAGKGEKIPVLGEILDLINKKVKVNIELKGEGTAKPVFKFIEKYVKEKGWSYEDFLISSFNHYELKEFSELNSVIKVGALIAGIPIGFAEFAEKVNAFSVNPSLHFINRDFVEDAHKRGLKVFVWTVNDISDIEKMKRLGVDGIFSNFPDRI
jgi:glycerophosphoryl diester phosphodiesterase